MDFIKLYAGLTAPLVAAGVDQAHRRGKPALANLFLTSWTDAANAGIDGIVHVVPGSPQLLPADRRATYLKTITGTQFMATWFRFVDLDSPEIRTMTEALVKNGVVLDLTLTTFEAMFRGNDSAIVAGEQLDYAPRSLVRNWQTGSTLSRGWSEADFDSARSLWPAVLRFAKHLYDNGVKIVVGTDTPNPWVAPGTSFHHEMRLYVDAGIAGYAAVHVEAIGRVSRSARVGGPAPYASGQGRRRGRDASRNRAVEPEPARRRLGDASFRHRAHLLFHPVRFHHRPPRVSPPSGVR